MEIIYKNLKDLVPYQKNPRKNDDAVKYVKESIKQFGFKVPIIIDSANIIVAGHTRFKAAKSLKLKEVPCIIADDLTDEQIKAFRLADNKVGEFAEWDDDLLAEEIGGILDIDMSDFGFDINFASEVEGDSGAIEEDYELSLPKEPKAKLGDIYQLGCHRLMCGDSTKSENIEKLTEGEKIDLLITDPPYNVAYEGKGKDKLTIKNDNLEDNQFRQFLTDAFCAADNVMKLGAVFYVWYANSETFNFYAACKDTGWEVKQTLIWNKNSLVLGRQDYQWKHEPCIYGWKTGAKHLWTNDRKQTTVLEFNKPQKNGIHPTMKPVQLFDYQIKNSTKKGEKVLDIFAGSGTTLIACEQNNRCSYNMEMDERYVDAIIQRWEDYTGEKAVLLSRNGGKNGE